MNTAFSDNETYFNPEIVDGEDFNEDAKDEKGGNKKQKLYNAQARRKIEMYFEEKRLESILRDHMLDHKRS